MTKVEDRDRLQLKYRQLRDLCRELESEFQGSKLKGGAISLLNAIRYVLQGIEEMEGKA